MVGGEVSRKCFLKEFDFNGAPLNSTSVNSARSLTLIEWIVHECIKNKKKWKLSTFMAVSLFHPWTWRVHTLFSFNGIKASTCFQEKELKKQWFSNLNERKLLGPAPSWKLKEVLMYAMCITLSCYFIRWLESPAQWAPLTPNWNKIFYLFLLIFKSSGMLLFHWNWNKFPVTPQTYLWMSKRFLLELARWDRPNSWPVTLFAWYELKLAPSLISVLQ